MEAGICANDNTTFEHFSPLYNLSSSAKLQVFHAHAAICTSARTHDLSLDRNHLLKLKKLRASTFGRLGVSKRRKVS